jgi:anion-transporting  ArsA/GET3 family ATPase
MVATDLPSVAWDSVRLHVVTGKGGTGKTTVAAALALALAAQGRRVLLIEVEGRQGIAGLFDTAPLPYEERKVAVAPDGGDVFALAIDAQEAVLEYLEMYYRLGRAGKALDRMGALDFATTVAPGLRDVLMTGKTYEAARRRGQGGGFAYDAIVMDAPPTGRVTRFLNVNEEVTTLTRVGPINRQADSIMTLFRSSATAVHVVTVLEEMPVQETVDGITELTSARLPVGAVIVNQMRTSPLAPSDLAAAHAGHVDTAAIRAGIVAGDLADLPHMTDQMVDAWADALGREVVQHADRVALEQQQSDRLRQLGVPVLELPRVTDGVDLGSLYTLADQLRSQGVHGFAGRATR